jgi:hypothetical protein
MVFFWACEVTETKAAVVKIPADYVLNVCHATLASAATDGIVSVGIEAPQMDASLWKGVVAHLGAAAHAHQVKLDLVVGGGAAQVKFYVAKGTGKVNLTGYFQPGPPADLLDDHEEVPTAVDSAPAKSKKRAREEKKKQTPVTWDQVRPRGLHGVRCMLYFSPICKLPSALLLRVRAVQTIWDRNVLPL